MSIRIKLISCALMLTLALAPIACADTYTPIKPNAKQSYAMNLFLSNFTEIGLKSVSNNSYDIDLVDFAHDHMWFNNYRLFEFGEYFADNNCRVSDDRIQSIVDNYFYEAPKVDLSQTRFDYDGEYYYHCETGGWITCGFAVNTSVARVAENEYYISFMIFSGGDFWTNDDLNLTIDEAWRKYGAPTGYGSALVYASDISNRSTYLMISYAEL